MSDHILMAFWLPNQKRFCSLAGVEIDERNLFDRHSVGFVSAVRTGLINSEKHGNGSEMIYALSPDGERRVKKLLGRGAEFKAGRRLTAIPPQDRAKP